MERSSGVLMPIASLPSPYGIGTIGQAAYDFLDFLKEAKQTYWQMLPVVPLSYGDSPYSGLSVYAGNPYFVDFEMLTEDGLLEKDEYQKIDWGQDPEKIDYGKIYENRMTVLAIAAKRGIKREEENFAAFKKQKSEWLDDFALYMALKKENDMKSWLEWPEDIKLRKPEALEAKAAELAEEMEIYKYIQYLFFRQWDKLRAYAAKKEIKIIGDIPIYMSLDSADVWAKPHWFWLDEKNIPVKVSGVPPDAFTADGQLWGNPLYRWDKMEKDGFDWWVRRIRGALQLYDVIRIDHFRGLESYWAVPYGEKTAKNGEWIKGPGMKLVNALKEGCPGTEFIAEDLGYLTEDVRKFLADSGFPGMNVLQFSFDARDDSDASPNDFAENSVCYTGTHDNTTLAGWKNEAFAGDVKKMKKFFHIHFWDNFNWKAIDGGMATRAKLFVAQMQDFLELEGWARINTPGIPQGNWRWRMRKDTDLGKLAAKIRTVTEKNNR
ncbi:MAG: 4-alpha-glucanotransferase [Lachnospiraceae bacterium]|nr:4-alpha-glucanotransferase [Lachnospiraceae bacterium]